MSDAAESGPSRGAILSSMGTFSNMGGEGGGGSSTLEIGLSSEGVSVINQHGTGWTIRAVTAGLSTIFDAVQSPIFKGFEGIGLDSVLNLGGITASITPPTAGAIKGHAKS